MRFVVSSEKKNNVNMILYKANYIENGASETKT